MRHISGFVLVSAMLSAGSAVANGGALSAAASSYQAWFSGLPMDLIIGIWSMTAMVLAYACMHMCD
jgi:hypothetical protein